MRGSYNHKNKIIIILNYQREIPPFIINEVKSAKEFFQNVYYVTPYLHKDNSNVIDYPNVHIYKGGKYDKIFECFRYPIILFKPLVLKEIIKAVKWKRISNSFLISFLKYLGAANYLKRNAQKIIKQNEAKDIIILASWLSAEAFAAALLKEKNNELFAASFAHSFEINPSRDQNIDLHFNKFIHNHLDNINFISISVYNAYYLYVIKKYNINIQNISFFYLGCEKKYSILNKPSSDGIFRIVSCSTVLPNKRLDRIIDVFSEWTEIEVIWTHLGDGKILDELKNKAIEITKTNPLITINFLGHITNEDVHKYYAENNVDVFINVSEIEGIPVSIMESMAYGIPAIATDVGGNKEIVNNKCGFIIPYDFTNDYLFSILKKIYKMDIDEISTLRINAYKNWKTNFDSRKNFIDHLILMTNSLEVK